MQAQAKGALTLMSLKAVMKKFKELMLAEKLKYERHLCSLFISKLYFIKRRRYGPSNDSVLHNKLRKTMSCFTGVILQDEAERKAK